MAGSKGLSSPKTRSRKATKSKKPRAPRGYKITSFKVNKTRAAEYRKAKNPDFRVEIVRHGRKPAEYFIHAKHLTQQQASLVEHDKRWGTYIAFTTKLKNGEIREIPLPYNGKKIEQFIAKAEKDPEKVNALKQEGDLFGFTVEGHKVQATFKDARSMQRLIEFYQNTGSKGAKISIFRIKKREDWQERPSTVAAIKRRRNKKEPRRVYATPLKDVRTGQSDKAKRHYEKIKNTEAYKERQRINQANYRKRLRTRRNRRKNSKGH